MFICQWKPTKQLVVGNWCYTKIQSLYKPFKIQGGHFLYYKGLKWKSCFHFLRVTVTTNTSSWVLSNQSTNQRIAVHCPTPAYFQVYYTTTIQHKSPPSSFSKYPSPIPHDGSASSNHSVLQYWFYNISSKSLSIMPKILSSV